jgi:hypothetical protein
MVIYARLIIFDSYTYNFTSQSQVLGFSCLNAQGTGREGVAAPARLPRQPQYG